MFKKIAEATLPESWSVDLIRDRSFPPLRLEWKSPGKKGSEWDALVCVDGEKVDPAQFAVLYQRDGTPRQVAFAASQIAAIARRENLLPLLLVPYLPEERLLELEKQSVSAVDLCGNGVLTAPGKFLVFRTGYPNRFTSSRPLKNIYRGVSSLVARAFLLISEYPEVSALHKDIARRGGEISLPTISKALKELEEDVIIRRIRQEQKPQALSLRLLQPEKLLSRLVEQYVAPRVNRSFVGKVALDSGELRNALKENAGQSGARLIATGVGSANRYATVAMENTLYVYTDSLDGLLQGLPATSTNRFPNLSIQQTDDPTVFFDPRPDEEGFPWASPITAYLEMMQGEARLVQTASQIKDYLLIALKGSTS